MLRQTVASKPRHGAATTSKAQPSLIVRGLLVTGLGAFKNSRTDGLACAARIGSPV